MKVETVTATAGNTKAELVYFVSSTGSLSKIDWNVNGNVCRLEVPS